jgi:hypothetical protein
VSLPATPVLEDVEGYFCSVNMDFFDGRRERLSTFPILAEPVWYNR